MEFFYLARALEDRTQFSNDSQQKPTHCIGIQFTGLMAVCLVLVHF